MNKEFINLLSDTNKAVDNNSNYHVLYWDYDSKNLDLKKLQLLVDKFNLSFHIIETKHGFHLIDFHFFSLEELQKIQIELQKILPSDYPVINDLVEADTNNGQGFIGQTLRITKKDNDLKYHSHILTKDLSSFKYKAFSEGHKYMYELVTETKINEYGLEMPTQVNYCSYLEKKVEVNC